jgi:hypothetical protein
LPPDLDVIPLPRFPHAGLENSFDQYGDQTIVAVQDKLSSVTKNSKLQVRLLFFYSRTYSRTIL